jgi:hypothetical protein
MGAPVIRRIDHVGALDDSGPDTGRQSSNAGTNGSGTANFDGLSYCDVHHVECDGFGGESLAPFFLWPVTVFVTFVVCLAAALSGPVPIRQRVAWAAMIGCSVFAANRNNLIWAALITAVAVWAVASLTE